MKFSLVSFVVCLVFLSSCAMYTKSNVKINEKKPIAGDLELLDYKDVRDGYTSWAISTPILFSTVQAHSFDIDRIYMPVGPELSVSNSRTGNIESYLSFLIPTTFGGLQKGFNSKKPRIEARFIYEYPVWKRREMIERFQMYIGRIENMNYYGILPTAVDIDFSLRGGVDVNFNSFYGGFTAPNGNFEKVSVFAYNTSIKIGGIFQRNLATRFNTQINGINFQSSFYETQGIYFDLAILAIPGNGTDIYDEQYDPISIRDMFQRRIIGGAIGYKRVKYGNTLQAPTFRFRTELGINPGYFPDLKSRVCIRFGVGIGLGKSK